MNSSYRNYNFSKSEILEKHILGEYLINSILSLKADNFRIFKTFEYSKEIKFSITTIIYNSNNDALFYKSINSVLSQKLDNVELIIINNGAKDSFLNELKEFLKDKKNISLIINPIPQFEMDIVSLYCPVISLANLGLLFSEGKLFTWLSWDDEINKDYCSSIYSKYIENGFKCFAPIPCAINLNSEILKAPTESMEKTFSGYGNLVDSFDIINSRIDPKKTNIFSSPGELLSFETKFLIEKDGFDFDVDESQYLKVSAGEKIFLVNDAKLFWRYHLNQAHHTHGSFCNSSHIKRIRDLYEISNIYEKYLKIYGFKFANKIKNYYFSLKIINFVTNHIINQINNNKFYPLKFFIEIKSELNLRLMLSIIFRCIKIYTRIYFFSILRLIRNPNKILKIKKYLKQL